MNKALIIIVTSGSNLNNLKAQFAEQKINTSRILFVGARKKMEPFLKRIWSDEPRAIILDGKSLPNEAIDLYCAESFTCIFKLKMDVRPTVHIIGQDLKRQDATFLQLHDINNYLCKNTLATS